METLGALTSGIFLLFITWYDPSNAVTDSRWSLVKENEAIQVFKRNNSDGYQDIRIEAVFHTSIGELEEVLNKVEEYPQWVYKCSEAKKIGSTESGMLRYWMISDFPFPFRDRELVAVSRSYYDHQGTYHSSSYAEETKLSDPDRIRVEKFSSSWMVKDIGEGKIRIEYEVSARPGGLIPPWLYNMAVDHGPFKTMEALQNQLEESQDLLK